MVLSIDSAIHLSQLHVEDETVIGMGLAGPGPLAAAINPLVEGGDETLLFTYTTKRVHVWSLNYLTEFWAHAYTPIRALTLVGGPLSHSSGPPLPRVVALGEDQRCVAFFKRSSSDHPIYTNTCNRLVRSLLH